jgi:beta-glucanase (GH16 family)
MGKSKKVLSGIFALLFMFVAQAAFAKNYKAAEIRTLVSYKYGRFETRMLASNKSGILSTMFTFNDDNFTTPQWNELDVEVLGRYNDRVQFNVITYNHSMHERVQMLSKDPTKCFITYAIEWTPSYVAWFIDGAEVYRDSGSYIAELTFTQKLMLNHWATNLAAWAGAFDPASLPAYAYYDFASYYSYTPGSGNYGTGNNFTLQWKDDFNSFNSSRWQAATHTFAENECDFITQNAVVKDGHLVLAITDQYNTGFNGSIPADCAASATATMTRTRTQTATPVITATFTLTRTATATHTRTATGTNTRTATGTSTRTSTPVLPTATYTRTATGTYSHTSTATGTYTGTATGTSTRTSTPVLPTGTYTRTATGTYSHTSAVTGTYTGTATGTSTRTSTPVLPAFTSTGTPLSSATAAPSRTVTSTVVQSPSFTATGTLTSTVPVMTTTYSRTSTVTPVQSVTGTPSMTRTPSGTPLLTATNTGTAAAVQSATSTQIIIFTPTATAIVPSATFTATFTVEPPTATFTATMLPSNTRTPVSTPTLLPSWTPTYTLTATQTAIPSFTASATSSKTVTNTFTATFSRTVTLTATLLPTGTATATSMIEAKDKFEIVGFTIFPNPVKQPADLMLKFDVTRRASKIQVRIYTTAYRRVIEETYEGSFLRDTVITVPQRKLGRLSAGIYYISICAKNGSAKAVSKTEESIILK